MKKILVALGIVAIGLCSCNIINPEVDEPNIGTNTETSQNYCLVTVSADGAKEGQLDYASMDYLVFNKITINDKDGKEVGNSAYLGSYYVPHDGTITINWKHRDGTGDSFTTSEYTINVGSAHQLDVVIFNDWRYNYCDVKIGGATVERFKHH